jgi:cytochrome c1
MTVCARIPALFGLGALVALAGCDAGQAMRPEVVVNGGNAAHGKQLISSYGCGACHVVPGVQGARGLVGPPLLYFSQRTMIAGELPNTPDNLVRWIENPKAVEPKTAMPDLGISSAQANDIAAYLYTLREPEGKQWTE